MPLRRNTPKLLGRLGLLLVVLIGTNAWAQTANMTLYVFKKGLPQENIEILIDDRVVAVTNAQGVGLLEIQPGVRYLELRDQDLLVLQQQLLINEDEVSQWIVNITAGLSSLVDVESSAGASTASAEVSAGSEQAGGVPGELSGVVISADDGEPIRGARIFISGQSRDLQTDDEGRFSLALPSGTYSLSVLHSSHNTITEDALEIRPEEVTELALELTPAGSELPEFVVIEPYIEGSLASVLEERRSELAVANILGAEQISKAGDSDAAGALRRVTGLTLVDGRFIYVRGLGERYSSTLLNGANVPSPDPTRRVVPLDLFPTGIVESIAVKKGYTADLPGEFGGGTVELRTRSVPESPYLKFELGLGYRDGTTFSDGLRYDGGGSDWTGSDNGARAQPQELVDATGDGTRLRPFNRFTGVGFTPEELEPIGESLSRSYDVYEDEIAPNLDLGVSGGYVWDLENGARLGFLAAAEYGDKWLTTEQQRTQYVNSGGGVLVPQNDFSFRTTLRDINVSWFLNAGIEFNANHRIASNWMLLRNTTDRAQIEQGFNADVEGGDVIFRELEWVERELEGKQLNGEHIFPGVGNLKIDWQYTDATAGSDSPDTRRYRYDPDRTTPALDDYRFSLRNDSNQRRWGVLDDGSVNWNIDAAAPLELSDNTEVTVRWGLNEVEKDRESSIRRFTFSSKGSLSNDLDLLREPSLSDIIFDATIDPRGWQLEEVTNATDAYTAEQTMEAWYLAVDLNLHDKVRLATGFRNESSSMVVSTFDQFDPDLEPIFTSLDTDDIFPYGTFTWLPGDHQIRAGYGETINRPDFKELSPSEYKDPLLDRFVRGNPDLQPAFITHYDIRWDYYFNPGEFISLGVFLKEFDTPIETVLLATGGTQLTTFDNAEKAENFGFEFEFYKSLGVLDKWWGWGEVWEKLYINTNYSWIDSEITLKDDASTIQTSDNRPLQGQSPYVLNFQIGYDDPDREINAALLYNVFGERIVEVGVQGAPDIYEQPRPSLDFVYSQGFGNWKLKGRVRNLLDPKIELSQGSEVTRATQPIGIELSLGLEYTFN